MKLNDKWSDYQIRLFKKNSMLNGKWGKLLSHEKTSKKIDKYLLHYDFMVKYKCNENEERIKIKPKIRI